MFEGVEQWSRVDEINNNFKFWFRRKVTKENFNHIEGSKEEVRFLKQKIL